MTSICTGRSSVSDPMCTLPALCGRPVSCASIAQAQPENCCGPPIVRKRVGVNAARAPAPPAPSNSWRRSRRGPSRPPPTRMGGEAPLRGLGLALVEPRASPAEGLPGGHGIQERGGRVTEEQQRKVFPPHEALSHRVNEHPQQPVEVPGDVQDADGLAVNAELGPREDFQRLFEGAEPTRQRDEPVHQRCHQRLALVHAPHHPHLGEAGMGQLPRGQPPRNHADHLAAVGQRRVGEHAHQPHRAASVDEAELAADQLGRQLAGGLGVLGAGARRRAREHANALHPALTHASTNSRASVPVHTSSTGPSRRSDQSARTWTASSPPGIRTVTRPWSQKPLRTAAEAAPQDDEPEARVKPAPRSQMRMSRPSRALTRANWTLVRFGKAGCCSIIGPSLRHCASSSRSTKTTQWGLPIETAVTRSAVPSASWSGTATTSRSGPFIGISGARKVTRPISTVTKFTRAWSTWSWHSTTPPLVSTVNVACLACPWSQRYLAKMRSPFPDFSASLPSGLKIRRPKSARVAGTNNKIPSEPTPRLRSQIVAMARELRGPGRSRWSMTR